MLKKIIALTVLIFVISCNDVIQPIFKEKLVYVVPDLFKEFTPPSDSIVSNRDKQWITNNFNQFIRERKFNGSILIAKNDEIIFDTLIGYTDFKSKKQLADTNAFQLASVSKPITATVILQMVAEGKINLEDKITTFFPFLPKRLIISLECPPPPNVTSTYTPSGRIFNPSTVSFNNTGL